MQIASFARQAGLCGVVALAALAAQAAPADIANAPLADSTSQVRANLMVILDNSGSMNSDYMPDNVENTGLCFGYAVVNRIFYDPNVTYTLPLQANGTPFPAPVWPNVRRDGYDSGSSIVDLSSPPRWNNAYADDDDADDNPFYYTQLNAGSTQRNCLGTNYRLQRVTTLPTAQRTNYLIWYSFYRTRLMMTRGAIGTVMGSIDATRFRIGLSAINNGSNSESTADSTRFLNIRDFDQTAPNNQRDDFYAKLYSIPAGSTTPLRPALEKIGKYYAGRQINGSALPSGRDPVQYSCQRNYTLLTTDGYWNRGDENDYRSSYGPTQLDGSTAIGNPDGAAGTPRPLLDDGRQQGGNWVTGGSGVANTLADIAMYFYATDLRTAALGNCAGAVANEDVCTNNVRPVGEDDASHQHMTTFTLGLGVAGRLVYRADYDTATTGDFAALKQGTKAWPNPDPASTSNTVVERIDDLWHAAVNGRGRYYSAANPADVVTGLTDLLERVQSVTGTGAAAATSTLQPVTGDNFVYLGTYTTVLWEGNIKALTIDPANGAVSTTPSWEARNTLNAQVAAASDTRTIWFYDATATNRLRGFTYANLATAGHAGNFDDACSKSPALSQCTALAAIGGTTLAAANSGANLVNYLRGQKGLEDIVANAAASRLYRGRATPLGDLINAAPVYVKKPPFKYTDAGYNTFASNNAGRTAVVYAAANDGMLHAFDAGTGIELWAFVPTAVLPNLYRLADFDYATGHRYFVDGTPVVGDVFDGTNWRTILVGGLGAGGRAYYALDVTDPANPRALWEFSAANDADLGLTYGNPVITKNAAGTWVVAFGSGVNNVSPGSGNGALFVLNAVTGALISKTPTYTSGTTPAGSATTPSNFAKISPWVDGETDNTARRFYGGDMLGNLWRVDFDDVIAPAGREALLLAQARTAGGVVQPITTRPQLSTLTVGGTAFSLVTVGTGRLLGTSDVADDTVQSLYVFKDALGSTGLGVLRQRSDMVAQTLADQVVGGRNTRRLANPAAVDWATRLGWYTDFALTAGERVNVEMLQSGNLLTVASNVPTSSVCTPGGSSWQYFFDLSTGVVADAYYGDAMTAGMNLVKVSDGLRVIQWNIRGEPTVRSPGTGTGTYVGTLKRISWRELVN